MRATWWVVMALGACGDDGGKATVDAPKAIDAPSTPDACVAGNPAAHVVYLSKAGGAYTMGPEDSRTNTTSILSSAMTLPAPTVVPAEWSAFVTCVTAKFAPFAVTVTDVDPGTTPHMEVVIVNNAQAIGFQTGTYGIAPFTCDGSAGKVYDNGIAFVMWDAGPTERCVLGAQMTGNLFGLDHAFSCPDVMTYLGSCGPSDNKSFTNMDVSCGEFSARTCNCGGATQNSFQTLARVAGLQCH